jgi:hypothetical protein
VLSPDATQVQQNLAAQIQVALNKEKGYLAQIQRDANQLVNMDDTQLGQPTALASLDDLVTQAQFAYSGEPDPQTGQTQGGAVWICNNIHRLASFDLRPYSNKSCGSRRGRRSRTACPACYRTIYYFPLLKRK